LVVNGTQYCTRSESGSIILDGDIKDLEGLVSLFDPLLVYK